MPTTIEKLESERRTIKGRRDRRAKEDEKDRERLGVIRNLLHRLRIVELEGKPDAVKVRFRMRPGDRCYFLNDALGTVEKVRRTRATVRFNKKRNEKDYDRWDWLIDELIPTGEEQGMVIF